MTDTTVTPAERETKPAQDIEHGDWLAADELADAGGRPARVLFVHPYRQDGQDWINVTYETAPGGTPIAEGIEHGAPVALATEAEIWAAQADSRRVLLSAQLRQLADLIDKNQLPLADHWSHLDFHFKDVATVAELAAKLGVCVSVDSAGRHGVIWNQGVQDGPLRVEWFSYAEKPEPEPAADPTGLLHSRADDADDPTPVSPARMEPHFGAVVDGGQLVDETAPVCVYETGGGSIVRQRCGEPIKWVPGHKAWWHVDEVWRGHDATPATASEASA